MIRKTVPLHIDPRGYKVLVYPDQVDEVETFKESVIYKVDMRPEKQKAADNQSGTVVAVGKMAWRAFDRRAEDWEPWAKVGDRVLYTKYGGKYVKDHVTGIEYILLNDEDISAERTEEAIREVEIDVSE